MAKDPAFLFYSNEWLQGTSSLMPEEKGIYIDLLCHQHQNKDLPNDTKRLAKMCGISEQEFLKLWVAVKEKFELNSVNRLVNRKLTKVVTERLTKSSTNKVIGQFASILRLSNMTYEMKELLKKEFKIDDFLGNSDRTVKERLTEWIELRSESIKNTNSISIYKEVKNSENGKSKNYQQFRSASSQGADLYAERIKRGMQAKLERDRAQNNKSEM